MKENSYKSIQVNQDKGSLEIGLVRPAVKNAISPEMIGELKSALKKGVSDKNLRLIVLRGHGGFFCSGADLHWMRETRTYSADRNRKDVQNFYDLFELMHRCPVPILSAVEGFALGGAIGLISTSDYSIAQNGAVFSLSELRLGLVPACIGPFVLNKIGASHCRALFLSAERFDAQRALRIGLVHEVVETREQLEERVQTVRENILACSTQAVRTAKAFLKKLPDISYRDQGKLSVKTLADIRITGEAQEGIRAFLDKRKPDWSTAHKKNRQKVGKGS